MKKLLLVMAGLLFADCAKADSITDLEEIESTLALMPNYGANDPGFLELEAEIQGLLGPSMEWTTAGNVATIDYWLSLASSLGESAALANDISGCSRWTTIPGRKVPNPLHWCFSAEGYFSLSPTRQGAMGRDNKLIDSAAIDYILENSVREPDILTRLRLETASHPNARFQIPPEQGQFFQLLIRMIGARRTLEVGVFTGYSSLAVALAMPPEGRIIACDISEEFTSIARRYWLEAGVAGQIDLRIGPAAETLDALIAAGRAATFDFAFIDADKSGYPRYYEQCLTLVRTGGVIALDNMLLSGRVIDESDRSEDAVALRKVNRLIHHDDRVDALLLPFADGLTLAVKK
jgi:predicted O-methyltransferase YrrM